VQPVFEAPSSFFGCLTDLSLRRGFHLSLLLFAPFFFLISPFLLHGRLLLLNILLPDLW
jgi:hypothetical protein